MGFLDEFKSAVKNEAADVKKIINKNFPNLGAESDNAEKDELQEMESDLLIQIGKMAVKEYGAEQFGEAGTMLLEVQQMIKERDEQNGKADKVCPNCGAPLPESSKFCPECGTKIN